MERAELLVKGFMQSLSVVPLSVKTRWHLAFPQFPLMKTCKRFVNLHTASSQSAEISVGPAAHLAAAPSPSSALLFVPACFGNTPTSNRKFGKNINAMDGVAKYKQLKFARRLKSSATVDVSMAEAIDAAYETESEDQQPARKRRKGLEGTAIRRSRIRMGSITLNLERRLFADLYANHRDEVDSMHAFSDGSPVTGREVQGMALELVMLNSVEVFILPGVQLAYGEHSLAGKMLAFVWALFLLIGPNLQILQWVASKIRSFTTDFGEIMLGIIPDIFEAFLRRLRGIPWELCAASVVEGSRLCAYALRITGWGHLWGNLAKYAAEQIEGWPEILAALRALTRFFRDGSWRDDVVRKLAHRVPNVKALLRTYKGKFIKWRYHTIFDNIDALVPLRSLCEDHLVHLNQMMPTFQDGALLQSVVDACQWKRLWRLLPVFLARVLSHIEFARRWGLVCKCCREFRLENPGKKVKCDRLSRRLGEVRTKVQSVVDTVQQTGRHLTLEECEGDDWVYMQVGNSARMTAPQMWRKCGWTRVVPFRMSECLDPEQAKICREQLQSLKDEDCGELELFHKSFITDLQAVANMSKECFQNKNTS